MSGSGGQQQPVSTQTVSSTPWAGAQGGMQQAISNAQNLFNADVGYAVYPGATQAGINPQLELGLGGMYNMAKADYDKGGPSSITAGLNQATNMINNQGLSPGLQSLLQQQQGQQNPYLQSLLDTSNRRIGDRINSSMSGAGRYGSGQHTDVMARALAESADPVLAQDYQQRQQMQKDIMQAGMQNAGQWAQLAPTLEQAKYAPTDRMMGYGQYYQDYAQKGLDNAIAQFNASQARPWEQINRLNAISTGAGALGGTKISSLTQPSIPTTNKIFGGAMAGAGLGSMFGAPGAGLGALGGGLLGMM